MEVDSFTQIVASQSKLLLSISDSQSHTGINTKEASVKLFYKGKWVARIIEGCNAISVIILFVSFVIAFTGKLKPTLLFLIIGSLLIHVFNVFRIALLCMALNNFPQFDSVLHDVIFPLVIYGLVFLLWIVWVNKYSFYAELPSKK